MCHAQSSRLGTESSLMIHISRHVLICALIIAQDLPRSIGVPDIRTNRAVRIEGLRQVETIFFDCHVGLVGIFVPYLSDCAVDGADMDIRREHDTGSPIHARLPT
jgi:hypothetical protein